MRKIKWRGSASWDFWLGFQYDFVSDRYIIGFLFVYFGIPKERWIQFKDWLLYKKIRPGYYDFSHIYHPAKYRPRWFNFWSK